MSLINFDSNLVGCNGNSTAVSINGISLDGTENAASISACYDVNNPQIGFIETNSTIPFNIVFYGVVPNEFNYFQNGQISANISNLFEGGSLDFFTAALPNNQETLDLILSINLAGTGRQFSGAAQFRDNPNVLLGLTDGVSFDNNVGFTTSEFIPTNSPTPSSPVPEPSTFALVALMAAVLVSKNVKRQIV